MWCLKKTYSPRATDFNQSVAIDLHYNDKNLWYSHIIDKSSRYSNAVIIRSKHPNIIKNFLQKTRTAFLGVLRKYLVIIGGVCFGRICRFL